MALIPEVTMRFGAFREADSYSLPDPTKMKPVQRIFLTALARPAYTLPVHRKPITVKHVVKALRERQGERSNRKFAHELGISAAHLGDIYKGKRNPGEKVLSQLGLAKRTVKSDPIYEAV